MRDFCSYSALESADIAVAVAKGWRIIPVCVTGKARADGPTSSGARGVSGGSLSLWKFFWTYAEVQNLRCGTYILHEHVAFESVCCATGTGMRPSVCSHSLGSPVKRGPETTPLVPASSQSWQTILRCCDTCSHGLEVADPG